jgi:hypothetical protein
MEDTWSTQSTQSTQDTQSTQGTGAHKSTQRHHWSTQQRHTEHKARAPGDTQNTHKQGGADVSVRDAVCLV